MYENYTESILNMNLLLKIDISFIKISARSIIFQILIVHLLLIHLNGGWMIFSYSKNITKNNKYWI